MFPKGREELMVMVMLLEVGTLNMFLEGNIWIFIHILYSSCEIENIPHKCVWIIMQCWLIKEVVHEDYFGLHIAMATNTHQYINNLLSFFATSYKTS